VADYEDDIIDAGAQLVWVLEQNTIGQAGTPEDCVTFMDSRGSDAGWCVGDSETQPEPGTFDESPFSVARGFDMIVDLDDMRIVWTTTHGTPAGNENIDGEDVLDAVQDFVGD
jgi:hypothetical protein